MQYVSSTPATRLDVINLQEKLDQQLQQRQVGSLLCRPWQQQPLAAIPATAALGACVPVPAGCNMNQQHWMDS